MYGIRDITAAYLEEVRQRGGKEGLNFIAEMAPDVLEQAEALKDHGSPENMPLYGMPIFIKDNIDVKGLHTTAGSLALTDNVAAEDAPVVSVLRKKGAVILGKTNMTEFANYTTKGMPGGYSSRGGQVIHAVDPKLTPSGSSSGSAVAVSSGVVDAAIGTDTSFSVVGCAQANGICGLKPPVGTFSGEGIIPIAKTLDSAGILANCFQTALFVYGAMRDDSFGAELMTLDPAPVKELRFAVNTANPDRISKGQLEFLHEIQGRILQEDGKVDEIFQPPAEQLQTIMKYEFKPHLEEYLEKSRASRKTLGEIVAYYDSHGDIMLKYGDTLLTGALYDTGRGLADEKYRAAMAERERLRVRMTGELEDYDAVILTGPSNVMHLCGLPSVSVASAVKGEDGVRRGIILYGADERRLYRAALALEELSGCEP